MSRRTVRRQTMISASLAVFTVSLFGADQQGPLSAGSFHWDTACVYKGDGFTFGIRNTSEKTLEQATLEVVFYDQRNEAVDSVTIEVSFSNRAWVYKTSSLFC